MALIFFFLGMVSAPAQVTPPAPLEVSVQILYEGYQLPDGEAVHAPAGFYLSPSVRTTLPLHAGDAVTIDIYADGQKLLSQRAAWHEETNPSKNARPGEAVPMIIQAAQFFYKDTDWTNVPEGNHVVLAHAYDFHGLSAFSKPMHITVLPPLPPRPVSGTHEAIGPPRPVLEQGRAEAPFRHVLINHRAPRAEYQVVGTVTARAPGEWSRDAAMTELKKQAAQLGANWVILDKFHFVDPISKTNRVFIEPEINLSGKALYVPSWNQSQTSNIER
ncbi:MAG TPA: hypothetical protein VNV43_06765 [Candidatus Acidoferrales bacterium]|jgi:hypothetical protein|nr:hypothetical protein [Candidatus Acidoferrales bacterium]